MPNSDNDEYSVLFTNKKSTSLRNKGDYAVLLILEMAWLLRICIYMYISVYLYIRRKLLGHDTTMIGYLSSMITFAFPNFIKCFGVLTCAPVNEP